jgi:hypothetical protein
LDWLFATIPSFLLRVGHGGVVAEIICVSEL